MNSNNNNKGVDERELEQPTKQKKAILVVEDGNKKLPENRDHLLVRSVFETSAKMISRSPRRKSQIRREWKPKRVKKSNRIGAPDRCRASQRQRREKSRSRSASRTTGIMTDFTGR